MTDTPDVMVELTMLPAVHGCRREGDYVEMPLDLRDRVLAALATRPDPSELMEDQEVKK